MTKNAVSQNFGHAYKKQLDRAPFYGLQLGMTPREWWEEVNMGQYWNIRNAMNLINSISWFIRRSWEQVQTSKVYNNVVYLAGF